MEALRDSSCPIPMALDLQVLAEGLDHVEGVCWDPWRHCLWAGGEAGQVYRIDLTGAVTVVATIEGGALLGIALDGSGRLYVCDPGNHQVWRISEDGTVGRFGQSIDYPNYAAFAADGRLYVSDSGSFEEPTGQVFVIDAKGSTKRLETRPISFANGLCVDGETLWVVESSAPGVSSMSLPDGALELVVSMERCVPDGLALDASGTLWISCFQPNQLWRWARGSGLELVFEDWTGEYALSPTNVAFYGENLDRLALASLCGTKMNSISATHVGGALHYPHLEREKA